MSTWTFPVQIKLARPPANAGEAQQIAARIEEALSCDLEDDLAPGDASVICMQPVEGTHRHTATDRA